jgi:pimeloyl-ACP methyl ester carboxylesterase
MKKLLRRIAVSLGLLIAAFYVAALGYLRLNENAGAFVGADLEAEARLTVTGRGAVPWDTVRVTTEDGIGILLLESRLAEAPEAPWVIYFYGRAGRLADEKGFAMYELFRSVGLSVLAVEYRGYGASEKTQPTEAGIYADARAAWRHLAEVQGVPASRLVLYGYSLGGAVAIQLATEIFPAGLITEGAFASAAAWVHVHYPYLPTAVAGLVMRNRFENLEKARSLSLPWLLFHGRRDSITPFSHAEALARSTAGVRRLVPLEAGHEDAVEVEGDRMKSALKEFIGELFGLDHAS